MDKREVPMNQNFLQRIEIDWNLIPYGSYLHKIDAIREIESLNFDSPVTFFVGENGTGKSTLIEAIAVAYGFNAEGGSLNYNFSTYDSHSDLCTALKITKGFRKPEWSYFLRAESFYNVATQTEKYRDYVPEEVYYRRYGGKALHNQSHGESFLALAQANFMENGLYILDEPEAALSPQRQLTLLMEIHQLSQQGAQFIIASHSPILLGVPGAKILSFDDNHIHPIEYTETESYQVTEMFINNREYLLKRLLSTQTED